MKKVNNYFDEASRKAVLTALKNAGVVSVHISVYGGGDSGEVDDVDFYGKSDKPMSIAGIKFDSGGLTMRSTWRSVTELEDAARDLLLETLENQGADWWNNDGGDGEITLDVKTGNVSIRIDVNETVSNTVVDIKDVKWLTV